MGMVEPHLGFPLAGDVMRRSALDMALDAHALWSPIRDEDRA